jgi:hypothetical protein
MNVGKFSLLLFLSLVIAILIFLEIACEQQVAYLTYQVSVNEARISQARQQNELLRQLVQRIAIESQRDPALLEILAKRGIRLSRGPGPGANPTTPPPTAPNVPVASPTSTSPNP